MTKSEHRLKKSGKAPLVGLGVLGCVAVAVLLIFLLTSENGQGPDEPLQSRPQTQPGASASESRPALEITEEALRKEAIEVMTRLVADFPGNLEALGEMGYVLVSMGNPTEGVKCWKKCIELDPNCIEAYRALAGHALERGQFEKVAMLARKALEINPKARGAHNQLGRALVALGRPKEAVSVLQKDVDISPKASASYFHLAQAYQQLGQYDKAKENYTTALRIAPGYTEACYGISAASARLGQAEDAAKHRRKFKHMRARDLELYKDRAKRYKPRHVLRSSVAAAYTNAGVVYSDNGRFVTVEEHWLRAAVLAPKNAECRKNLVLLYQKDGSYDKALPIMEQLIGIEPKNPTFHREFSILLANANRIDDALSAIKQAMQLDPDNIAYWQIHQQLLLRKQTK